jgi:transposase InsO family protein
MRTPTAFCASTSPRAPTCPDGLWRTCSPSKPPSTADPARSSTGRPPPRSSTNNYGRSHKQALQPPVEPRQYTSKDFVELCAGLGVTQSMGAVGTSADNALAEAFNATLKRELLQGAVAWPDELTCRREIFRWATRYNTRRRHSWCGQQAPNTYEQQTAATLPQAG